MPLTRGRPSRVAVYRRLEDAITELRTRLGGLPSPTEAEHIWSDIWHLEAHNSTAIEGNTLVLREVEKLLEEGKAVGSKPLADYAEVKGYGNAAKWVYSQALKPGDWATTGLLSVQEIRHVHHEAMTPVWSVAPHPQATAAESPGNFRQHEIAAFPEGMKPPPSSDVGHLMHDWVHDVDRLRSSEQSPLPEALAHLHNRFEQIHPFLDGNGRTGRLVLNLILGRLGYPPAIIFKRDRDRYLRAMRRADRGDPGALGELIARSVTDNLYRFVVPAVAGPARLVPLAALTRKDLSAGALRSAAIRGRLRAQRSGNGDWHSSKAWVDEYVEHKHKRLTAPNSSPVVRNN